MPVRPRVAVAALGALGFAAVVVACVGEDPPIGAGPGETRDAGSTTTVVTQTETDAGELSLELTPASARVRQGETLRVELVRKGGVGNLRVVPRVAAGSGIGLAPFDIAAGVASAALDVAIAPEATRGAHTIELVADDRRGHVAKASLALVIVGPPGTLDPAFGDAGVVLATGIAFTSMALLPDGRILAAGNDGVDAAVARFLPSGAPDPTFGGSGTGRVTLNGLGPDASGLLVQPSGRIVVLVRPSLLVGLKPDGSIDDSFASETKTGAASLTLHGLAAQPDGKLVACGRLQPAGGEAMTAIARFSADGVLDEAFAAGGIVKGIQAAHLGPAGFDERAIALRVRDDGSILAVGSTNSGREHDFAAMRVTASGALDPAFNGSGSLVRELGGFEGQGRVVLPDGARDLVVLQAPFYGVGLLRLLANGAIEPWPSGAEYVRHDWDAGNNTEPIAAAVARGLVYVGGHSYEHWTNSAGLVSSIHIDGGVLDTSFGPGGFVASQDSPANETISAVAIDAEGRLVVAGHASSNPVAGILRRLAL